MYKECSPLELRPQTEAGERDASRCRNSNPPYQRTITHANQLPGSVHFALGTLLCLTKGCSGRFRWRSWLIGLQLLPVVLSLIVLGAHFLRSGSLVLVAVVLILLCLLGVRRVWTVRTVQVALLFGVVEWVRTLARLVALRAQQGEPVLRLTLILGSVALLTGLSTLMFRSARLRRWYEPGQARVSGGA